MSSLQFTNKLIVAFSNQLTSKLIVAFSNQLTSKLIVVYFDNLSFINYQKFFFYFFKIADLHTGQNSHSGFALQFAKSFITVSAFFCKYRLYSCELFSLYLSCSIWFNVQLGVKSVNSLAPPDTYLGILFLSYSQEKKFFPF